MGQSVTRTDSPIQTHLVTTVATKKPVRHTISLVEYLPPSLNAYVHNKGVRMTAVKRLQKVLEPWWVHFSPLRIPAATGRRLVQITLTFPSGRKKYDTDNCQKIIKDALVNVGLLKGDSTELCECPEPIVESGLFACTKIELMDRPEDLQEVPGVDGRTVSVQGVAGFISIRDHGGGDHPDGVVNIPIDHVESLLSIIRRRVREMKKRQGNQTGGRASG